MPEWNGRFEKWNGRQSSIFPFPFHTITTVDFDYGIYRKVYTDNDK